MSKSDRKSLQRYIEGEDDIRQAELLGSGNFSNCYSLPIANGLVVKTTNGTDFVGKELSDVFSNVYDKLMQASEIGRSIGGSKKTVQSIDLKTTLKMLTALRKHGFATPTFYGFSVKANASPDEIQEYQFMERINRPTLEQIFENSHLEKPVEINYQTVPHADYLRQIRQHFESDDEMLGTLVNDYYDFKKEAKRTILDLGDVEMRNLFAYAFDPQTKKFTLMMIDPIREQSFIRPIRTFSSHEEKVNYFKERGIHPLKFILKS